MSAYSHYLPLKDVTPGMVLATDLLDNQGHVLLPKGASMTESVLRSLAHHEIHQLCVLKQAIPAEDKAQLHASQIARIRHLFRHMPDDGASKQLKQFLLLYREEQAQ